jgi:hypothetical protein
MPKQAPHQLQEQPPEGARDVIKRELSRHGEHGGNRAGKHEDDRPKRSSQAAGKDPHRGKGS